jgi:hypothetical protein
MNPVDLIRELTEALRRYEAEASFHDSLTLPDARPSPLLTRAQAFLAAQPVVVEVVEEMYCVSGELMDDASNEFFDVPFSDTAALLIEATRHFPDGARCTVHVIVTPGVR